MEVITRDEIYSCDLVDYVAQQIAAPHAIVDSAEHGTDHISPVVSVGAGELAQICEEPGSARTIRPDSLILIDEREQLVSCDALRVGGPVAPTIRRLDGRAESLTRQHGFLFALCFQVVKKLQKHDPGQ